MLNLVLPNVLMFLVELPSTNLHIILHILFLKVLNIFIITLVIVHTS